MSEPATSFETLLEAIVRRVVREEIAAALNQSANGHQKEWLNSKELAEAFSLPATLFEEKGRRGEIARTKNGRYYLYSRKEVEAYLASRLEKKAIVRRKKTKEKPNRLDMLSVF